MTIHHYNPPVFDRQEIAPETADSVRVLQEHWQHDNDAIWQREGSGGTRTKVGNPKPYCD
jgi:hypothetical protein